MSEINNETRDPTEKLHPIAELAVERFGEKIGMHLLWEETCFPMSDVLAMDQMKYLIAKADRGETVNLDGWEEQRNKQL